MNRSPTLRHLEVFHWVMSCATQAEAARVMGTSQPALSRDLARLEQLLGYPLFIRRGRRLVPTPEAVQIHREIRGNYLCLERLVERTRDIARGTGGVLRIGSVPSIGLMLVPEAIRRTASQVPRARFELYVLSRDELPPLLAKGELDVAFTVLGGPEGSARTEHLVDAQAVCVFHPGSPLARLKKVSPRDLQGQPFISLASGYQSRQHVDAILHAAGVTPDVVLTTQTAVSACGMIRSGYGVAVIDPFTARACASPELLVRPFRPAVHFTFVTALPCRPTQAALVARLRENLAAALEGLDGVAAPGS